MSSPKVDIYTSSVSGNRKTRDDFIRLEMILMAKKVPFNVIDVSVDPDARAYMKRKNLNSTNELPQIFVNGEFKGVAQSFFDAFEDGIINDFMGFNIE